MFVETVMCKTPDKGPLSHESKNEQVEGSSNLYNSISILTEIFDESYEIETRSQSFNRDSKINNRLKKKKNCLRKLWEAVGIIIGACGMYFCYYPVSSTQAVMFNDYLIFFLTINTIREARLISITLDKKRHRKRRNNEKNANITVREITKSKKESTGSLFFFSVLFFSLLGTLFLPIFHLDESSKPPKYHFYLRNRLAIKNNTTSNEKNVEFSVLDIHFIYLFTCLKNVIGAYLRAKVKKLALLVSKHTAIQTFKNPLRMHFRLQQIFTLARLLKYLPQLLGTCNKLNGHVQDFVVKWRQRRRKRNVDQAWSKLMRSVKQKQCLERTVRKIQYEFRRKKEIKSMKLLAHMKSRPRKATAVFQRIEEKVNKRIEHSRQIMNLSEQLNEESLQQRIITYSDQRRLQKHKRKMRATKKRLLLAPNTTFSVCWKIIAISCVLFDVLHIAISPYLSGKMDKMPLDELIEKLFLSKNEVCQALGQPSQKTSRKWSPILDIMNGRKSMVSSVCVATSVEIKRNLIHLTSKALNSFLYAVSFVDVFVTFFTGEYQNNCGIVLQPKQFFSRWILPGIALQLIVNPSMHHMFSLIKKSIAYGIKKGPSKMLQMVFLVWPVLQAICCNSFEYLNLMMERSVSKLNAKSELSG